MRWISPSRPTLLQAFLPLAQRRGWLAEEGLDLRVTSGQGTADVIGALARGEAELGLAAPLVSCPAIAQQDAPIISVGQVAYRGFFAIASAVERPLSHPRDFRGKRIGVVSRRGGTGLQLDAMSLAAGLDPGGVEQVVTGLGLDGLAALRQGRVDGFFVFYESRAALEIAGEPLHYLPADDFAPLPGGAILARLDVVRSEEQSAALRGMLRACARAIAALRDPAVLPEIRILQREGALAPLAEAATERALHLLREGLAPPGGLPQLAMDVAAWESALRLFHRLGLIDGPARPIGRYLTNAFVVG